MDASQFDKVSRLFAERRLSRRRALSQGSAGLAAGLAVASQTSVVAQESTPEAGTEAGDSAHRQEMLFVQSFGAGSIAPTEGVEGRYTVTLEHGLGQTIYFSDRPDRIVGAAPTPQFLDGLGFHPDNPPNAALVVEKPGGETDIAVVELFNPVYDEASHTATYEVAVLANWEDSTELGFTAAPTDLAAVEPTFGAAHLFIDGCAQRDIRCVIKDTANVADHYVGTIPSADFGGFCYDLLDCIGYCNPCTGPSRCGNATDYWANACNEKFSGCYDMCWPDY